MATNLKLLSLNSVQIVTGRGAEMHFEPMAHGAYMSGLSPYVSLQLLHDYTHMRYVNGQRQGGSPATHRGATQAEIEQRTFAHKYKCAGRPEPLQHDKCTICLSEFELQEDVRWVLERADKI